MTTEIRRRLDSAETRKPYSEYEASTALKDLFSQECEVLPSQTIFRSQSDDDSIAFELQHHRFKLESGKEISVLFYDLSGVKWQDASLNTGRVFKEVATAANLVHTVLKGVEANPNLHELDEGIQTLYGDENRQLKAIGVMEVEPAEKVISVFNFVDISNVDSTVSAATFIEILINNLGAFPSNVTKRLEHTYLVGKKGGFLTRLAIRLSRSTSVVPDLQGLVNEVNK